MHWLSSICNAIAPHLEVIPPVFHGIPISPHNLPTSPHISRPSSTVDAALTLSQSPQDRLTLTLTTGCSTVLSRADETAARDAYWRAVLNEATLEPQVRGIVEALLPLTTPYPTPYSTSPYYPVLYPSLYSLLYYPLLPLTYYPVLYPLLYPLLYYPVPQEMEALLTFAAKTNPFIAEPLG